MNSPILGLDIGLRRTGVALSESGLIAQPLTTVESHVPHATNLIVSIIDLVRQHSIRSIVVGMPYGEGNEETLQSGKTLAILQQLEAALRKADLSVEVIQSNEFHSTQDAQSYFPDADKDAAAAAIILQDYLEQSGNAW